MIDPLSYINGEDNICHDIINERKFVRDHFWNPPYGVISNWDEPRDEFGFTLNP
jgi:hypothetical protein